MEERRQQEKVTEKEKEIKPFLCRTANNLATMVITVRKAKMSAIHNRF